jgi:hypothetical protein
MNESAKHYLSRLPLVLLPLSSPLSLSLSLPDCPNHLSLSTIAIAVDSYHVNLNNVDANLRQNTDR